MSRFSINLYDKGRCRIRHESAGAEIITDLPPEYGGHGRSFSSTDLVAAALGSCILTSIDSILEREGYDPKEIRITVKKLLSENPKMISAISLEIFYPLQLSDVLLKKLERATATCPVKRSLNDGIASSPAQPNWTTEETSFFQQKGENPNSVKLNLVINGKGTVWIDDIRLLKGQL